MIDRKMHYLPKGQLPIAGDSDIFPLSLISKPGCDYFWDHESVDIEDEDEEGHVHYRLSHGFLQTGAAAAAAVRRTASGTRPRQESP